MHRKALVPVSQNNMHARAPMVPSAKRNPRASLAFKRTDDRRSSAIPSTAARRATVILGAARASNTIRASTAFSSGSRTLRQDPRPLNDRSYVQRCVRNLIEFLMEREYDSQVSAKTLTNPTTKDFLSVFLFLMHQIDPTFAFQKRFEDEIPAVLKSLGYPFSISKSALSAVGSPHTWPSLLGVLMWLVSLITYDGLCAKQEETRQLDHRARREAFFHDNLAKAYVQWLHGAEGSRELDEELEDFFKNENEAREAEILKLNGEVEQLNATRQSLKTQPSPLVVSKEHLGSLQSNIKKFELLLPSLKGHLTSVEKKIAEEESQVNRHKTEVDELLQAKNRLKPVLEQQEMEAIDAERIVSDREKMKDLLKRANAERAQVESEQKASEHMATDVHELLSTFLSEYHRDLEGFDVHWTGCDLQSHNTRSDLAVSLTNDASVTDASELLSKDIEKELLPQIDAMKEMFAQGVPSLHENLLRLKEEVSETEEKMIMLRHDESMLKGQKEKREVEYEEKKRELETCLQQRSEEIMKQDEELDTSAKKVDSELLEADRRVHELLAQRQALQKQFDRDRQTEQDLLMKNINIARQHQRKIREETASVKNYFESETAVLDSLPN